MKQRNDAVATARRFLCQWPRILAGGLALAAVAAAAQSDIAAATAGAAAADAGRPAAAALYRVTSLGPGDIGVALNAKGQVAFTHADPFAGEPTRAWFYDGARKHEIGTLGGTFVRTRGLNDAGEVTGVGDTPAGIIRSFVWSRRHGTVDVGTLPGMLTSWEPVINNRGVVAGYADGGTRPPWARAFRWSVAGGIEDLGVLLDGDPASSYATAINDAGLIAGTAWAGGSDYHAFAWTRAGGMVDIDTLGNHHSTPVAVGAGGEVAGNLTNPPDNYGSVFWWTRQGGMRDLGAAGGQGTNIFGMSRGGRIAGVIIYPDFSNHAMTWTRAGGMRDLGTLGGHSSAAQAANDRGQVVGVALTADDRAHAFVWSEKDGMVDLNTRLARAPAGLELITAVAIADNGTIVASSNAGLLVLTPFTAGPCGHVAGPIAAADMVAQGAPLDASLGFVTDDAAARYTVAWSWGDGTAERVRGVGTHDGRGGASARHAYAAPGIYTITADVRDQAGNGATVARRVVVHAPAPGAAAGTGTVMVPATRGLGAPRPGGAARFHFVTPPPQQARSAGARGRFLFDLPGFVFASDDVRVAAQGTGVQLAGTGKLNGASGYRFTATATATAVAATAAATDRGGRDGAARFGIRIWHTDPLTGADVVDHDSLAGAGAAGRALSAGRIVLQ
ncbi:PKD domain-containing protein [uncultured Massilia sp.]|uniref:PKD domain-containing protein n=1 Tax=uncultured Massilia sp. TaxID=169973 RepID=UPI0025EF5343|nr:PKD domain-containing protein [uncultured Massilia sp.]